MIACTPTLSPLVRYYRDQSTNRSNNKYSNGHGRPNSRAIKHSGRSSDTDTEGGFTLDHIGDTTTVINGGGARDDLRGMEGNDSEEYIMSKGDVSSAGGIRADTEVTVEISRSIEPTSAY